MTDQILPANHSSGVLGTRDVNSALWRALNRPWVLLAPCIALFLLAVSTYYLPQMPGQLRDDPLAAARWLIGVSADYGLAGDIFRPLGLFAVLYSPLLHLLLALTGLTLLVNLGTQVGIAWQLHRLPSLLQVPAVAPAPLAIPPTQPLYRWRQAQPTKPDELVAQIRVALATRFDWIENSQITLPPQITKATGATVYEDAQEQRLLATRLARWSILRPLLLSGLLSLFFVIWLNVTAGWAVSPPALAPGGNYRYAARDLRLRYAVTDGAASVLEAQVGQASGRLAVADAAHLWLGAVEIQSRPGPPGLLVSTAGAAALSGRPGQSEPTDTVGLLFPQPGSEESVVLADQGAALRIVRLLAEDGSTADPATFSVEVYANSQEQPSQRIEVRQAQTATLTLAGSATTLRFVPLPGLLIDVRYLPGGWLIVPALALMLLGMLGCWVRPAFVFVQIAPWPEGRALLIVQSDSQQAVVALQTWLGNGE